MRKRRPLLLALALFCLAGAFVTWRVYPDLRQRQLDNQLLAAISRSDTPAVLSLLDQGANPNAHGDPTAGNMSLWQLMRESFTHQTPRPRQDVPALHLALGIRVSKGTTVALVGSGTVSFNPNGIPTVNIGENINMIIALLQHGGTMRPAGKVVFHPYLLEDPRHSLNEIGFTIQVPKGQTATIVRTATPQQLRAFRKAAKMDEKR